MIDEKDGSHGPLSIWTIYAHPSDYPDGFVARRFEVSHAGSRPTRDVFVSPLLEPLRYHFLIQGLACLTRSEADDACIVEVWL